MAVRIDAARKNQLSGSVNRSCRRSEIDADRGDAFAPDGHIGDKSFGGGGDNSATNDKVVSHLSSESRSGAARWIDRTMRPIIHVINPNSNEAVTDGLAAGARAAALRRWAGHSTATTLAEGPFGIETQKHVESVTLPLGARLVANDNSSSAFVIACYSDPGLHVCREVTSRPVFGIAECGVLTALAMGASFGVIAIKTRSIPRHIRYLRQMGLMERLAGERALEMSVAETASGEETLQRMIAGRRRNCAIATAPTSS